jgi:hypothetical protein
MLIIHEGRQNFKPFSKKKTIPVDFSTKRGRATARPLDDDA